MGLLGTGTRALLAVVVCAHGSLGVRSALAQAGETTSHSVVVVVAKDSPVRELSRAELRRLFLGQGVDRDGVRLVPVNQPVGSETRVFFDQAILELSPAEAGRYWVDRKIRGDGAPPRSFAPLVVRRLVANVRGSIGYLRADQVDDTVRVVPLDGVRHDSPRYALRDNETPR